MPLTTLATMAPWARRTVYLAGGVLFASGIGMSAYLLASLAEWFGVPAPFSYLLAAALDAGAVIGVVMWVAGSGPMARYGELLAKQMLILSVLGNGLERALTFAPGRPPASPDQGLAVLLERTIALFRLLTTWTDPVATLAAGALLMISVGIGVVFPLLSYRMAHALILVRQSAESLARTVAADVTEDPPPPVPDAVADQTPHVGRPSDAEPAGDPAPVPVARQAASVVDEPGAGPNAAPTPQCYVHDGRDLEPGTPEWQQRYDRLPGNSKRAKLEHWLAACWENGDVPTLTRRADRVVNGNGTGPSAKRALVKRGVYPPDPATLARDSRSELVSAA